MKAFEGKAAVITGGAHGIGRAVADAFLREGASVWNGSRRLLLQNAAMSIISSTMPCP